MADQNNNTILSATADETSEFSRRQQWLSVVSGGALSAVAAQGAFSGVVVTTGLPTSAVLLAGATASAAIAGQIAGRGLVRALSIPERREIIAKEVLLAEGQNKDLLLAPEADGSINPILDPNSRFNRFYRGARAVMAESLAVTGASLTALMASGNPISITLGTVMAGTLGYVAGQALSSTGRAIVGLPLAALAEWKNMAPDDAYLPGGDLRVEPDAMNEARAELEMRYEHDLLLADGEGLDISDLLAERERDPSITATTIRAAAQSAVKEAREAAIRLRESSVYAELSESERAEIEANRPDFDGYLRWVEDVLDEDAMTPAAKEALRNALWSPRFETAQQAINASANPDARVFADRARDGIYDIDPTVDRFVVIAAWVTEDGRIVSLRNRTQEDEPDFYAVQAVTNHPVVATTNATIEYHATLNEADAAARGLTASLPEDGLPFPKEAMTEEQIAEQRAAEMQEFLSSEGGLSMIQRINDRVAEVERNPDLTRPVTLMWTDGFDIDKELPDMMPTAPETATTHAAAIEALNSAELSKAGVEVQLKDGQIRIWIDDPAQFNAQMQVRPDLVKERASLLEEMAENEDADVSDEIFNRLDAQIIGGVVTATIQKGWKQIIHDGYGFIYEQTDAIDSAADLADRLSIWVDKDTIFPRPESKPSVVGVSPMVEVTFYPQAWVNDYAVDVDPEGSTTFSVPLSANLFLPDQDGKLPDDNKSETDNLRTADTAPKWIADWPGPFYCEVNNRDEIEAYFAQIKTERGVISSSSPALAEVLTDRWIDQIRDEVVSPAERALIADAVARLEAAAHSEGDAGARAETFFYARDNDGNLGWLSEFEFDDDQAPSPDMIANFETKMERMTAGIDRAKWAYIPPGNAEVFNGRAAFQMFLPDNGGAVPTKTLDEFADYTAYEFYRAPDPEEWLYIANHDDETTERIRQFIGAPSGYMDAALAQLASETYGIADQWTSAQELRTFAQEYALRDGHDPEELSLLQLRIAMMSDERLNGAEILAMKRWRSAAAAAALDVSQSHSEVAARARKAAQDAVLSPAALEQAGFFHSDTDAIIITEAGTDRVAMIWNVIRKADEATLWVENGGNLPRDPGVQLVGGANVVMGEARISGASRLNSSRIGGKSEITNSRLVDARVSHCNLDQCIVTVKKLDAATGNFPVLAYLDARSSTLTDCKTAYVESEQRSTVFDVAATNTEFCGECWVSGGTYEDKLIAGDGREGATEAPHGGIMVLPKNDQIGLTGKSRKIEYGDEVHTVFQIVARGDITPAHDIAVEAGTLGGWIADARCFRLNDESHAVAGRQSWVGADAFIINASEILDGASVKGASPEEPAYVSHSTVKAATVIGSSIHASSVSDESYVGIGWNISRSDIQASRLREGATRNIVRNSKLDGISTYGQVTVHGSQLVHAVLGEADQSPVHIRSTKGENFVLKDGNLDRVEIGAVRFAGAAKEMFRDSSARNTSILTQVDLADVRIAPASSLSGTKEIRLTLPPHSMVAGTIRGGEVDSDQSIVTPIVPNIMLTGDWASVEVGDLLGNGQKTKQERVFEITAINDLPARSIRQVQLDGEGHERGTIPEVRAGMIGGHIGKHVRLGDEGQGFWIEPGGVVSGNSAIHERAFVNHSSHVHDAKLHGEAVIIDAIVLDDDTIIGLPKTEADRPKKDRYGFKLPTVPQNPVIIGSIVRHSRVHDVASIVAPLTPKTAETGWGWNVPGHPIVSGVSLTGHMTFRAGVEGANVQMQPVPGIKTPGQPLGGRSAAQRAAARTMRKLIRPMKAQRGAVQNADAVKAIKPVHHEINKRGDAERVLSEVSRDGKIGVIRAGMDCDGVQYHRESVIDYPKSLRSFVQSEDKHEQYLDGPETTSFVTPDKVTDGFHNSRDIGMEAFEDGHPHALYTAPLSSSHGQGTGLSVPLREMGDLGNRELRAVVEAAIAYEAGQPAIDRPITTYMAHLGVGTDSEGRIGDSDIFHFESGDPRGSGLRETLRHMGGSYILDGETATYSYDPVAEYAARIREAESTLSMSGVTVTAYRVPAPDAEQDRGAWRGHLDPRGNTDDRLPVTMRFLKSVHDTPALRPDTAPGDVPALHSAERIDGDRLLVRFQTVPEPDAGDVGAMFRTAIVPHGATVEPSALQWSMPDMGVSDLLARKIAERDPLFYTRSAVELSHSASPVEPEPESEQGRRRVGPDLS